MPADYTDLASDDRIVARFLDRYYAIWRGYFSALNKRAHWHVIFSARSAPAEGVSCRAIHRTLYGAYGTDIRTCIERIKDCERDGFVRIIDAANKPCPPSPACLIVPTAQLEESFDSHCADTIQEVCAAVGERDRASAICGEAAASAIFEFFAAYDRKWRDTAELVVRSKKLTPAYLNDAMDHLITYQYWAIIMLLWSKSEFGGEAPGGGALVIDEINSRMWEILKLGHLAIKERVGNLIRWGFFSEETIKKHKAVSLTPFAGDAISKGLAETKSVLVDLHRRVAGDRPALVELNRA